MWVPFGAGAGDARFTLSYPGLETPAVPATVELPIEQAGWLGWPASAGGRDRQR